ncbi:MAG: methyltransferase domain-containing protein [Burkholderiales bacterium]|nr:methyltransferase domain-containing protein [Burkholderiales bacterium]
MADFQQRDPLTPAFWDERFERQFTPWDRGGVPRDLQLFAEGSCALRTLIPGCGSAYELAYLAGKGWDATAIDFSPSAVAAGKAAAGAWADRVVQADFFQWQAEQPLQLTYERAFLCAMPRALWPQVAARWASLLPPGGLLAGFFFFDDAPKGPPFGIGRPQLDALLHGSFELVEERPASDSIPVFAGKERWMVWRRLSF